MIAEKSGNLLDDDAECLVITTNTLGVMGKGIAKEFRQTYPRQCIPYYTDCKFQKLQGGSCNFYLLENTLFGPRYWAAFCTKENWRNISQYSWIQLGLNNLLIGMKEKGLSTVAIPMLGCGNGNLNWRIVYPMIRSVFFNTEMMVRIYI